MIKDQKAVTILNVVHHVVTTFKLVVFESHQYLMMANLKHLYGPYLVLKSISTSHLTMNMFLRLKVIYEQ